MQQSPRYPGGFALRLARVLRYRPDKKASEADTIERVREIFAGANRKRGDDRGLRGRHADDDAKGGCIGTRRMGDCD